MFHLQERPSAELEAYSTKRGRALAFLFASLWCAAVLAEISVLVIRHWSALPAMARGGLGVAAVFFSVLWGQGLSEWRRLEGGLAGAEGAETRRALELTYGTLIRRIMVSAIAAFVALKAAAWMELIPR
jgi:ABC-type phosphate transport system permease subunit